MKKSNCFTFLALFFLVCCVFGCSGIQMQDDSQELVAKISARHVGYKIITDYPDIAKTITPIAEAVLIETDMNNTVAKDFSDQLKTIAMEQVNDPLLKADISDLVGLIKIDGPTLAVSQVRLIRVIANGLLEGIKLNKGRL